MSGCHLSKADGKNICLYISIIPIPIPLHLSSSIQTIPKVPDTVTVVQFNSGAAHPTADSSPETVAAGLSATAEIMHRNASISHLAVLRASLVTAASAPQHQLTEQALQVSGLVLVHVLVLFP